MEASKLSYQFGEFTLDVTRGTLFRAGAEIRLRPKVYETLRYFIEHPNRLISKRELMQAVWPDSFVTDDSLVQCTLELRRALDDAKQELLQTLPRRGYVFNVTVTQPPSASGRFSAMEGFDASLAKELSLPRITRKRLGLPIPRTSFIGREQQVRDAADLLLKKDIRLLTLTGPGGSGKTRLAIALGAEIMDHFTGGVQFVPLAAITQPELVATALADALEIQQIANRTIPQLIGDQLNNVGPFLLLLDNFEQVMPATTLVAELLDGCPSLKIVVTSRSCLHIYGEQEFPVTPLTQNSAMELFVQRAAAVWPTFAITAENGSAVQEICSRLDGLPLAIELAAARTRVLSPIAILERLQKPLQLLTGGAVDLPERQQTLRSAINWSYSLLNGTEQKLFRRLAVFVGGCTLEAAEAVCNTGRDLQIDLLEGLSSLVDKSLVQRMDRTHNEPRFAMLETIREFALESLISSGEEFTTRRGHAAYCLVLGEEGNPELNPSDRNRWLTQCDAEIDNFRSAIEWLIRTSDLDWSLRLAVALFRFWDMREHLSEGRIWLETVLGMAGEARAKDRARVSHFIGALAAAEGNYRAAEDSLIRGLSLYEELGDESGIAASLNAIAIVARDRGDYGAAQSNFERSLACWRLLSDQLATARCLHNLANVVKVRGDYPRARWALSEAAEIFEKLGDRSGAAWSMNQEGDIAREIGDMATARALYERALFAFQETGDPWGSARSLTDLGYINCVQGNHLAAYESFQKAIEIFAGLGHRRGIARALEGYACLALAEGQAARALTLASSAAHVRKLISAPLSQAEQSTLNQWLAPAWTVLDGPEAESAWARGSAMNIDEAIKFTVDGTGIVS